MICPHEPDPVYLLGGAVIIFCVFIAKLRRFLFFLFDSEGITIQATFAGRETRLRPGKAAQTIVSSFNSAMGNDAYSYHVRYKFTYNGKEYTGSNPVPFDYYDRFSRAGLAKVYKGYRTLPMEDHVPVKFLPFAPSANIIADCPGINMQLPLDNLVSAGLSVLIALGVAYAVVFHLPFFQSVWTGELFRHCK